MPAVPVAPDERLAKALATSDAFKLADAVSVKPPMVTVSFAFRFLKVSVLFSATAAPWVVVTVNPPAVEVSEIAGLGPVEDDVNVRLAAAVFPVDQP